MPFWIAGDSTRYSDRQPAFRFRLAVDAACPRQRYSRRSRTLSFNAVYSCSSSSTMMSLYLDPDWKTNKFPTGEDHRNYRTQVGEPVAMTGVERGYVRQGVRGLQYGADSSRHACHDSSIGIDRGGYPGISIAQQPVRIFHGTHASLFQMLSVSPAVTVPAVVRNVHEDLRPIRGELADFIRKDGLVADEDAEFGPVSLEWRARSAAGKITDFLRQSAGKRKQRLEGNVFTERNEVNFVIAGYPFAIRADQRGGIVQLRGLF